MNIHISDEWSTIAVRYMCEYNPSRLAWIDAHVLKKVKNNPELSSLGPRHGLFCITLVREKGFCITTSYKRDTWTKNTEILYGNESFRQKRVVRGVKKHAGKSVTR